MDSTTTSPGSLKRSHDEIFDDLADLEEPCSVPSDFRASIEEEERMELVDGSGDDMEKRGIAEESLPTPPVFTADRMQREMSRSRSMTGDLTDAGSRTPSLRGDSPALGNGGSGVGMNGISAPSAFAALNGTAPPPPKKAKLTFQEKELRRINKEIKDQERAAEKVRRDAEKQAHVEEKARKDAEKEAEKKKREAEKEEKRVAAEAEKAAKEEKRRKKEEERQRADDEKRKKDRNQMTLGNFFAIPNTKDRSRAGSVGSKERSSTSPAPPNSNPNAFASPAASTPSKPQISAYEKMFPAFFVHTDVTVAPITRFERDGSASETIQRTIDSYIHGNRSPGRQREFDAQTLFYLSNMAVRGKKCMPVKDVMEEMSGNSLCPIDLTTDSQNSQIKRTTDLLRKIPFKFLCFQEDVRPPYRGTYTSRPINGMTKLARNPLRRDLPDTNYDYDSEAEWVEDEDAEDLKSEADDEEEVDEDEDMDGFLDDENDETAHSRRLVLHGDLEPVSTGLCWEDRKRRNSNVKMMPYRMEVILDPTIKSIDPFSTSYWEPPKQKTMDPPRLPLNTMKPPNTTNSSNPKSVKPFFTLISDVPAQTSQQTLLPLQSTSTPSANTGAGGKPKKLISEQDLPAFKAAIEGSDLSKVGLIEVLKKKFPGRSAAAIRASLEVVAKRVGAKEVDKRWVVLGPTSI